MGLLAAVISKMGENAKEKVIKALKMFKYKNVESFIVASADTVKIGNNPEVLLSQDVTSQVVIGCLSSKVVNVDGPQIIKLKNSILAFDGRIYPSHGNFHTIEAIAEKLQKGLLDKITEEIDGDFVFTVAEPQRLIAVRSVMGVKPLYYGENKNFAAVASTRKALWKIGVERAVSFPPGNVAFIDKKGIKFRPTRTFTFSKPKSITMEAAAYVLQNLLTHSIQERLHDLKEVAVAFSGGLDSSLIAFLAKRSNVNVRLIHVSLENRPETVNAIRIAEELKLPLHVHIFKEENVEKTVPKVVELIEESDPVKTSVGIPFYWIADKASEMGINVMLAGQGADELFGGYRRYVDYYLLYGPEKTRKLLFNDVVRIHETNLERDFKICNFHNIELRLPFVKYKIIEFAISLPLKLKIDPRRNVFRKLVLRHVAKNLGLPKIILENPKKAIQYATGINKTLKKLARKRKVIIHEYLKKILEETIVTN